MASQLEQKEDPGKRQAGHNMHQLRGNKQHGTERAGTLLKQSDGLRKVWQKRRCTISNGYLTISHSMLSRPPAKLNLLTCQVKPNVDDKKRFDLVSHNRTFRFWAEDEQDCAIWVSVLSNSKEGALNVAFSTARGGGQSSWEELSRAILEELRGTPGNRECSDCSAPGTWVSIRHQDMFESDEDLDEKMGPEKRGSAHSQSCCHPPAAVPRPEAAEAAPQEGWPDTFPSPATALHGLDVPQPPSHPPPSPPQQAKRGALKALDPLCKSGHSKVEQPGPHQSLQEPDPCSGHAWNVPLPQRSSLTQRLPCRVCALYDCDADREDELTFHAGEVIVVWEKEDSNWWKGWIEGQPHRQGVFPASFVRLLSE